MLRLGEVTINQEPDICNEWVAGDDLLVCSALLDFSATDRLKLHTIRTNRAWLLNFKLLRERLTGDHMKRTEECRRPHSLLATNLDR